MKVYILDNGWLECDENNIVAMSIIGTTENKKPTISWIRIPVFSVLIDHPDGKIIYDLGCHPDAMKGHWPNSIQKLYPYFYNENQDFQKQLALTDTKPEDIKTVVLSHMHMDHIGNMHLFKHADVYVHRKDFEQALVSVHLSMDQEKHGAYAKGDLEVPVKQYHLIENDFELTKGIDIITLPGHTPGILGLVIKLGKDGVLIFPQDAIYTARNYNPPRSSGVVYDSLSYFKSIEKVRCLASKYNAKVMFPHDMDFFKTMKIAPEYYE